MFRSLLSVLAIFGLFTVNPLSLEAQDSGLAHDGRNNVLGHDGRNSVPPHDDAKISDPEVTSGDIEPHDGRNRNWIFLGSAFLVDGEVIIVPEEQN